MIGNNLSHESIMFLHDLQQRLKTDNNRATREPIFNVREKYKATTFPNCGDEVEYIETVTGDHSIYETEESLSNDLQEMGYNEDDITYIEHEFNWDWRVINSHFTEKGAQDFIDRKKHDYGELEIYVDSLTFCNEMSKLRDILLKINIPLKKDKK